jgi:hypothetical protein
MVHTNPEFETSNLILDFEFDQHLESRKHVINIIMWFRDIGCYSWQGCLGLMSSGGDRFNEIHFHSDGSGFVGTR